MLFTNEITLIKANEGVKNPVCGTSNGSRSQSPFKWHNENCPFKDQAPRVCSPIKHQKVEERKSREQTAKFSNA